MIWQTRRLYGEGLTEAANQPPQLTDENCERTPDILEDGGVHGADEIRAELNLSMQKMARVSSALLKTGMVEETGAVRFTTPTG